MILVLGGTTEGKRIATLLRKKGFNYIVAAVTEYGVDLVREEGTQNTRKGPLNLEGMAHLLEEEGIKAVVDATHPFSVKASLNAREAARRQGKEYLRLERPSLEISSDFPISRVEDFNQAAEEAVKGRKKIFLALGVNHLEEFLKKTVDAGIEVVARVLPLPSSLEKCYKLGLKPSQVVDLQGGGSRELNRALFKEFRSEVLVTKDSGKEWTEDKVKGALDLGMRVILVKRPFIDYGNRVFAREDELVMYLQENLPLQG